MAFAHWICSPLYVTKNCGLPAFESDIQLQYERYEIPKALAIRVGLVIPRVISSRASLSFSSVTMSSKPSHFFDRRQFDHVYDEHPGDRPRRQQPARTVAANHGTPASHPER